MCSFLPNVFNSFISLLWYITCTMFSLTMKNIKVNFFLLYLFWIDPLFKCRPVFFCQENSFKESYFIYFFIYKKHAYKSVIFFFIYIFFIITFVLEEKYSTGQIEIESYVVGSLHNYILRSLKFALTGNWKVNNGEVICISSWYFFNTNLSAFKHEID